MKKRFWLYLVVVLLLSLCHVAFAAGETSEHPVLPDGIPEYSMPPVPEEELISSAARNALFAAAGMPEFTVT